ncbi:hypothetical protein DERP_003813 [Dermatophagoides pteronyssinus]|uniref:Uncharacterized protein n=1 Tax=Dermatophagoides pteronyssinus TaxID=6956 RepID=A0ABQ8JLP0_DERPT|nr:hypothetical protein DERP_003813 [Dermatophagoides pteronyssinus]
MVFGLMTSPIRMIFSLLLMQGISLTMFRAFLNQAIQRVDPLKFQFNLGNTNQSGSSTIQSSTSQSPSLSSLPLFQSLMQHYQQSQQLQVPPTPAPLVDQRVIDLVQLIRSMQPSLPPPSTTTTIIANTISINHPKLQQTTTQTPPALQIPIPTSNYPGGGIIMVIPPKIHSETSVSPTYSVSASNHIEKIYHNNRIDEDNEIEDGDHHDNEPVTTTTPKPKSRKTILEKEETKT